MLYSDTEHTVTQLVSFFNNYHVQTTCYYRIRALDCNICKTSIKDTKYKSDEFYTWIVISMHVYYTKRNVDGFMLHTKWKIDAFTQDTKHNIDAPHTNCNVDANKRSSIWQLCCHWWHRKLSKWQFGMPPVTTELSNWRYFVFYVQNVISMHSWESAALFRNTGALTISIEWSTSLRPKGHHHIDDLLVTGCTEGCQPRVQPVMRRLSAWRSFITSWRAMVTRPPTAAILRLLFWLLFKRCCSNSYT